MTELSVSTASFILTLIDDFTGKNVEDNHHMFLVNGQPGQPIYKQEGYYVFVNIPGQEFSVTIKSAKYHDTSLIVTRSANPCEVRMHRNGAFFPDCTYLKGQGGKHELITRAYSYEPVIKLKEIVSEGEQTYVVLHGYGLKNLSGLCSALGDKAQREYFIMGERIAANSYVTVPALRHKHKEGSELMRCYRTICDETGGFCLPVEKHIEEGW